MPTVYRGKKSLFSWFDVSSPNFIYYMLKIKTFYPIIFSILLHLVTSMRGGYNACINNMKGSVYLVILIAMISYIKKNMPITHKMRHNSDEKQDVSIKSLFSIGFLMCCLIFRSGCGLMEKKQKHSGKIIYIRWIGKYCYECLIF